MVAYHSLAEDAESDVLLSGRRGPIRGLTRRVLGCAVIVGLAALGAACAAPPARNEAILIPPEVQTQIDRLRSPDRREQAVAAFLLGEMGEKAASAVPSLIGLLSQGWGGWEHLSVRRDDATGEIRVWGDEGSRVSEVAAYALRRIGKPAAPALIAAMKSDSHDTRLHAVGTLWDIKDSRAFHPLIEAMDDRDGNMRIRAVQALLALEDPRTFEAMVSAMADESAFARQGAAEAFERMKDPRAVDVLVHALDDEDHNVQIAAAEALGAIGDPRVIEPLLGSLKSED